MTDKKHLIDPGNVESKFLAECLGMTAQGVSRLGTERIIRTNGRRGRYELTTAIPMYLSSLRGTGAAEAKAKFAVQQERKLRLANDKEAAKLVPIEQAAEAFRAYCLAWRAGASALPRRLATQLSNESNPAVIQKALNHEFAELFTQMENGLSEYFAANEYAFAVVDTGASVKSAAPGKKPRPVGRRKKNTTVRKRGAGKVAK